MFLISHFLFVDCSFYRPCKVESSALIMQLTITQEKTMSDDEEIYNVPDHPLLVIISGPSGVGKDTMLECIRDFGSDFSFVVTMTTRPKRATETDGVDYFFVSHSAFQQMIIDDELLEYSLVYGDYKGIPKNQVRKAFDSGKDVMM